MKGAGIVNEKWIALLSLSTYLILTVIWYSLTNAPWDDDCVTRYFSAKNAIHDPIHFIALWNRPLFILLFFIPFQLSKHTILLMAVITALAAYSLYQGAKEMKIRHAYLVIPILLFQAFFFTISRSSLAEPLAAAIISFGFLFYARKNFLLFAITGSLIPLCRLELSPLLLFWMFILWKNGHWKHIFLLGVPTLLWNFAGTLLEGDLFWLYEQTLGKDNSENRYGHTTFGHYFQRFIYVIGPVVFYFFIIGFLERLFKFKMKGYVAGQFVLGFMIYVLFSWKLNLGQAAGFLRHLVALSPLIAMIALYGYNYWVNAFQGVGTKPVDLKPELPAEKKDEKSLEHRILEIEKKAKKQHLKPRVVRHLINKEKQKYAESKQSASPKNKNQKQDRKQVIAKYRILLYSFVMLLISYFFFSKKLRIHHLLTDKDDYRMLIIIGAITLLFIILTFIHRKKALGKVMEFSLSMLFIGGLMSYTLITEPPNAHNSPERETLTKAAKIYANGYLKNYPTYVNHNWVYWVTDLDRNSEMFNKIKKENLEKAPDSSIVIWENHYSSRLAGDVPAEYLQKDKNYIELFRMRSSDNRFLVVIFQKINGNASPTEKMKIYDRLIAYSPDIASAYVNRANLKFNGFKDHVAAILDYNKAIEKDSAYIDAYYNKALSYFTLKDFNNAKTHFLKAAELKPDYYQAIYNAGASLSQLGLHTEAVEQYSKVIELKEDYFQAYNARAIAYSSSGKFQEAINDYTKTIELKLQEADSYLSRGRLYLHTGKWEQGCKDLQKAHELGNAQAIMFLQANCGQQQQ